MKLNNPTISIIIPVLNEQECIGDTLNYLRENSSSFNLKEILVVDGGSTDRTVEIAQKQGVRVVSSARGRAKQQNAGAKHAQGDVYYFLHVDTLPPKDFDQSILEAVNKGHQVGCFQMKFDSDSRFLKFFAWFTRVNIKLCRGGDQSLFITKDLFQKSGGFNEQYLVYEDNEFIGRLYGLAPFKILPRKVKTSARRYEERGEVSLQYHFGMIHLKNYLGAGPEQLLDYYKRKIVS
ncbi:glycosyltransferase [Flavobacteriaceae bacterium TP-CH-4]|uniref:Glycosyltransferase n=1 Tax=Pelagihabitans pacificus TaxID=2696054 RepID=A0A967AVI0_9FLAO|nr:TIGR04283 family arsenosugar biosynthesis glycosyltransferase [Pelagihabitans pacificus]NHF60712.1 glycosyltransferase [Pelagihabitans pacificus]